jgi:ATP-dependent Clp protease, protease subunit
VVVDGDVADLLGKRIIVLRGAIDDDAANVVIAKLLFLQSQNAIAPIRLHIDSPGGAVASALAIRDMIDDLEPPVYTNGRVSFTPITSASGAPAAQGELTRTEAILTQMLAQDTGQSIEQIESDQRASRRFDAEQARSYGLVDDIAA